MKEYILDDYKKNKKTYHAYRERIINLLTDLLSTENMVVHQLVGRTKSLESLSKKIDDKNGKYNSVDDITDIVGIRIITYLESDIDPIAELIEKEFVKDIENSVDKRKLQADRFGYKSLHVVVSFNTDRIKLKEYKRYKDLKCEIQIRSILQHAWAEIEHDLGYKGEISVPDQYKRSFNRVSALLETADIEFDRLKLELKAYEKEVPNLIVNSPDIVDINKASIISFIDTNSILLEAKELILSKTNKKLYSLRSYDKILKGLSFHDIHSIGTLDKILIENKDHFLEFVKKFVEDRMRPGKLIVDSAPLLYFIHYLASKFENKEIIRKYAKELEFKNFDDEYYLELYNHTKTQ